jgi:hypothetical protein
VMTDNALAYRRGHAWRDALTDLGAQGRSPRVVATPATSRSCCGFAVSSTRNSRWTTPDRET